MKEMKSGKKIFTCFLAFFLLAFASVSAQQVLTLDKCREMALQQNKKIRIAKEDSEIAAASKKVAATKYLPHISLNGGYLRTTQKRAFYNMLIIRVL